MPSIQIVSRAWPDDSKAEMNIEVMQKPITYERADDANCRVRNKIESVAPNEPDWPKYC
jgi:hypothetical protein